MPAGKGVPSNFYHFRVQGVCRFMDFGVQFQAQEYEGVPFSINCSRQHPKGPEDLDQTVNPTIHRSRLHSEAFTVLRMPGVTPHIHTDHYLQGTLYTRPRIPHIRHTLRLGGLGK